jgi:HPt (histidine-containing phosphotransfer) domain-containing protein
MDDYVSKPIEESELAGALARWLAHREVEPRDTESSALPALPGLNLPSALHRVRGNESLLRRLVIDFARDSEALFRELSRAVKEDRTSEALAAAHTLKGSAASLSAGSVAAIAAEIENALRSSSPVPLGKLETALAEVRDSAALLADPSGSVEKPVPALDEAPLKAAMAELRRLLQTNDLSAGNLLAPVLSSLAGRVDTAHLSDLESAVDQLLFDEALAVLDTVSRSLGDESKREDSRSF